MLVEVLLANDRLVPKMLVVVLLVIVALVIPKLVEVPLVNIDEDARRVPVNERVFTADRYKVASPNAIPPVDEVEEARVRIDEGVVVPSPSLLLVAS